jgi:hypothetical protein
VRSSTRSIVLICTGVIAAMSMSRPAWGIPAFARAYGVPCSGCHTAISRRSEFGDVFRKAGYHWPGSGDLALKPTPIEMEGSALARGLFPAVVPLALSVQMSAAYTNDPDAAADFALGRPTLRLLFGASVNDHVSFFGTWSFQGEAPSELYIHIARPILGRPELNARVGMLDPTTTLFRANEALIAPFILSSSGLNGHTVSQGRLGGEINGSVLKRLFWAAGAVQNAGVGSNADTYYHVSYKIGGMDLAGNEPDLDLSEGSIVDDVVITLGHWAYWGRVAGLAGDNIYRIRRFGLDARLGFRGITVWGGVMLGLDRDLTIYVDNESVTWFGEVSYPVFAWLMPMYLYQYQDAASFGREVETHDLGFVLLPLENTRAVARYSYSDDGRRNDVAELQILFGF